MTKWTKITKPNSTWNGNQPPFVSTSDSVLNVADYGALNDAMNAIGPDNRTLYITNDQTISSTTTLSLNVSTVVPLGGKFHKVGSGKLVILGPFSAGNYQVFSGFSASDIAGLSESRPEWFGLGSSKYALIIEASSQAEEDAAFDAGAVIVVRLDLLN